MYEKYYSSPRCSPSVFISCDQPLVLAKIFRKGIIVMATMQSDLDRKLAEGDFDGARELLQEHLLKGDLISPNDAELWAKLADKIHDAIKNKYGNEEIIKFWKALLDFVEKDLKKKWVNVHRGHIYFRLGFATAKKDFNEAYSYFKKAVDDDRLLEINKKKMNDEDGESEEQLKNYSAYVALAIFKEIKKFDIPAKQDFINNLIAKPFNDAIYGKALDYSNVYEAIDVILNDELLSKQGKDIYKELIKASEYNLTFTINILSGALLEFILMYRLMRNSKNESEKKKILKLNLEDLIKKSNGTNESIRAIFNLIRLFRNRVHPSKEKEEPYKLTLRISNTIKNLLERGLLEWEGEILKKDAPLQL